MPNLLHRHVLKSVLVATGLALGLFVFVLLTGNAVRDIAELVAAGKLAPLVFLKLLGLLVPYVAAYALPLGVLTGTLIVFGRLSSQREITAMKSVGVGLYQIASPVFLLAFGGMVLAVLVNLHYAPQARLAYKQLLEEAVTQNPVKFIEPKRFIDAFPGYVIYMGGREGETMKDFWIWELDEERRVRLFLRAREGTVNYDRSGNALVLTLKDGTAERREGANPETLAGRPVRSLYFGELPIRLPLGRLFGDGGSGKKADTDELTFAQLMSVREAELEKEAARGGGARENGGGMTERRLEVQMHLHKNLAMAFSVFSLAVFGVPLAVRVGRSETYANLGVALAIAMTYYFLMVVVSWFEDNRAVRPDLLVWLPNLLFQGAGFYLLRRAARH